MRMGPSGTHIQVGGAYQQRRLIDCSAFGHFSLLGLQQSGGSAGLSFTEYSDAVGPHGSKISRSRSTKVHIVGRAHPPAGIPLAYRRGALQPTCPCRAEPCELSQPANLSSCTSSILSPARVRHKNTRSMPLGLTNAQRSMERATSSRWDGDVRDVQTNVLSAQLPRLQAVRMHR